MAFRFHLFANTPLFLHFSFFFSGFTPGAKELFKQENYLALYRLPSDDMVKETLLGKLSFITKRRPPLSHMISLFVKDTTTSKAIELAGFWLVYGQKYSKRGNLYNYNLAKCHVHLNQDFHMYSEENRI